MSKSFNIKYFHCIFLKEENTRHISDIIFPSMYKNAPTSVA